MLAVCAVALAAAAWYAALNGRYAIVNRDTEALRHLGPAVLDTRTGVVCVGGDGPRVVYYDPTNARLSGRPYKLDGAET